MAFLGALALFVAALVTMASNLAARSAESQLLLQEDGESR